jgi:Mor family transcriptional regulator
MTSRAFTPEQDREVARLYMAGWHSTELAKVYGCTTNTVLGALRREGVEIRGYPKAFTQFQQDDIVYRYQSGEAVLSIADSYRYSQTTTIYRVLRRRNILLHDNNVLSPDQEAEVLSRLQAGEIITDLASEYNVSLFVIRNVLDRNGIEREEKRVKYELDIHAFDRIDSEAAAYYLGFIYADGGVIANKLRVELQARDIEVLEGIRGFFKSNALIKQRDVVIPRSGKTTPACSIELHSQLLADRLKAIGIVPRRSHFELTQEVLSNHLYRHFIRGFMDGDGSLSNGKSGPMIRFYGQQDILKWIVVTFHRELDTNPKLSIRQREGIKVLNYSGGRQCRKITRWLYDGATIWLSRKHEKAMSWLE